MNGEVPSVPITTLAGIASLVDLLPEMPLPSPLPQTLCNKSLLFHPRVAEEAQRLLSTRDEALIPQLMQSLNQTSSEHIELKDYLSGESSVEQQQNIPELLSGLLQKNPEVFKGPKGNVQKVLPWSQQQQPSQQPQPPLPPQQVLPPQPVLQHQQPQQPQLQFATNCAQALPPAYMQLHQPGNGPPSVGGVSVGGVGVGGSGGGGGNQHFPSTSSSPSSSSSLSLPLMNSSSQQALNCTPPHGSPAIAPPSHFSSSAGEEDLVFQLRAGVEGSQFGSNSVCTLPQTSESVNNTTLPMTLLGSEYHHQQQQDGRGSVISEGFGGSPGLCANSGVSASVANVPATPGGYQAVPVVGLKAELRCFMDMNNQSAGCEGTMQNCNSFGAVNHHDSSTSLPVGVTVKDEKVPPMKDEKLPMDIKMREPIVRLSKLSVEDQALMQKSLKAFAEKSPAMANKLGLTPNNRIGRSKPQYKELSSSDSETDAEPKNKNKYFKAREKERELKRKREKDEKHKRRQSADDDYVPELDTSMDRMSKRRRSCQKLDFDDSMSANEDTSSMVPKKKLRKIERKLVPVLEKLSAEELMETNTYQRFNRGIETIFDNTEDLDLNAELDEDGDAPPEALIPKYQLQDLCSEAAKLKARRAMESIPPERLVRLLSILEKNIRDGAKVSPIADPDDDEEESKLWTELTMERVMRAVDASLTALYIMTSPNMPKRIYLEDVIDRVVLFTKYQLQNTIYPSYDPVYRIDNKSKDGYQGSVRKKRTSTKEVRGKSITSLYNKLIELVGMLAELLNIQVLTDNAVLHASTLGVSPFFVENISELQLSALRLVTAIFTQYDKHRRLLLDDILASIARLPSSKRGLRTFKLTSDQNIQMLTALVLRLIQCVASLPNRLGNKKGGKEEVTTNSPENKEKEKMANVDTDVLVVTKYDTAVRTAGNFLTVFLNKCGSKNEEIDYRPLFENFVCDLLATVNKPQWPAAELLLSLLGKLLVQNFSNKNLDMSLRVASLDYLGVVASRLRKDAVSSELKIDRIDQLIKEIKEEEQKESEEHGEGKKLDKKLGQIPPEEERHQFLQKVLLDHLAVNAQSEPALLYTRHFYIAQWYKDAGNEISRRSGNQKNTPHKSSKKNKKSKKKRKDESEEEETTEPSEDEEDWKQKDPTDDQKNAEVMQLVEKRKRFLINKIRPFDDAMTVSNKSQVLQTYLDDEHAELISRFLAAQRPFSQSFDVYLKQILRVLTESSIAIRTKAMKCLTMVVEADPGVLRRTDMQLGVHHSFLDHSTSVREAAVDLVGKFVLSKPDLIDKYYDMLSSRILDTGVSVRKRVIKILKDICIECPEFSKIPEICVKMIRRVNDEEGIRKLVMEVFQNMWFTPVREKPQLDSTALIRKVMNITDVVAACKDTGLDWFEQLLVSLFKPKEDKEDSTKVYTEPPKSLVTACRQIVDCLVENVLRIEEGCLNKEDTSASSKGTSQRLVACLTTLHLFAKIRPQLLVDHATTLQPYLSLRCQTQGDYQIISNVARTLELVIPLLEHPSETFLAQLEEDSVKLILQHDKSVVSSCLSCLGSVVNNVTHNYKLIRDCFKKYFGHVTEYKRNMEEKPDDPRLLKYKPFFRRAVFTVGMLLRHFDFGKEEVRQDGAADIVDQVFDVMMYFISLQDQDMQSIALQSIGSICIRHYNYMLGSQLKDYYHYLLTDEFAPVQLRIQVLNNIETYLQEEELRMIKQDQEWSKLSKQENLKEMGDISSGMASTVVQLYLKQVLESFLHPNITVRHAAFKVIQLILQQGLVHPVQIVPYLLCMSTDIEQIVSHSADKQLQDIEKKYPGFIHMKVLSGIRLSYKLQRILQGTDVVRGYRVKEGEPPCALNGFLYSLLRSSKQQRRAIQLSLLRQFDEQAKTTLSQMLYLADNLAYFPFQVQDEPLFIIHHIDILISVSGSNLLQAFKETLSPPANHAACNGPDTEKSAQILDDEDEDEDVESILKRIPDDTRVLQECITASQGCLLLLVLKQHLKDSYGISDTKISQYSPSESGKIYEKAVSRKNNLKFEPKGTLVTLKMGLTSCSTEDTKKALVEQYLDFKQLMLRIDPDEEEEDEDIKKQQQTNVDQGVSAGGAVPNPTLQVPMQKISASQQISPTVGMVDDPGGQKPHPEHKDGGMQKVPKLTIVPIKTHDVRDSRHSHRTPKMHKAEKHRKHKHKRKKRKIHSDEEDSGEDYSDPDFLI